MTRVVYWNNIPAPYMVERFNALARRKNVDFEAWFSARSKKGRSWRVDEDAWEFEYRYLPSIERGTYPLAIPTPLLRGAAPDLFVSLYAAPSFLFGWALAAVKGARTAFWVEVTYDALVKRRRWKEALKSAVFPRADAILTAGEDGRAFAARYGAHLERIIRVPHVIDFARYAAISELSIAERARLREELGLHGVTFVYIGRLWRPKGLAFLLEAFDSLQSRDVGAASLLLVGDGPDENALRAVAASAGNVVFAGFRHADELPRLYAAGDVFVFPTLGDTFGLVVSEAMACGLPVISTSAAGEIGERVEEGVNGFLVDPGNAQQLADRMTLLARDGDLRQRMGKASVEKVTGQAPAIWAEAFEHAVAKIVSMPRLRDDRPTRRVGLRETAGRRHE